MMLFAALAAAMTLAVAWLVAAPLARGGRARGAPWAAFAVLAVLAGGAGAVYLSTSNWSWKEQVADSPAYMVSRLARRLEREPENLEGWLQLGRAYLVLEQHSHALRAYRRADELAGGRSAEALIGLGEALTLRDDEELAGRAGRFFEAALELDPTSGKALFFGAAAALRRGEPALARERFAKLLTLEPPQAVRSILEQQIAALDIELGGTPVSSPRVRIDVDIAPQLRASVDADAPLYVIVRDPDAPGPPLAVKRLVARFPQSVELSEADAMIAGRDFTAGQRVQVVARVARSGSATARSGDPFGEIGYRVGDDGSARITIDRLTP